MAVNSIFHTSNVAALATEQNLYRDLVIEAIQTYGHDVHYLDRTLVNEDSILGTDSLAKFNTQAKIEMYRRKVELEGMQAVGESFRNSSKAFKDRAMAGPSKIAQIPELIERGKIRAEAFFDFLNKFCTKSRFNL